MMDSLKWRMPKSKMLTICNGMTLLLFLLAIAYAIIVYPSLPEKIPTHFSLKGEADGWGNKGFIFLTPLMLGPTLLISYFIGKYAHYFHAGELTKQDQEQFIVTNKNISLLNLIISSTLFYMVWMTKRNAVELPAYEKVFFPLIIALILMVVAWLVIQSFRIKKRGRTIDS